MNTKQKRALVYERVTAALGDKIMDPITWDHPALSTPHKAATQRQAAGAIAALEGAGFSLSSCPKDSKP